MARHPEQQLQEWYALFLKSFPVLFCASAGGMRTNIRTAVKMKRAGYIKGHPDIVIYEPRSGWLGMCVELKVQTRPTPEQVQWQKNLNAKGYYSIIVPHELSFQQAQDFLETTTRQYLKGEICRKGYTNIVNIQPAQ